MAAVGMVYNPTEFKHRLVSGNSTHMFELTEIGWELQHISSYPGTFGRVEIPVPQEF